MDEAYRLVPEDVGRDFGPEALETLMRAMSGGSETATNSPSIILAGYIVPMDRVINANPGLADGFETHSYFRIIVLRNWLKSCLICV